jgi:replicative DNA helicase
MESLKPVAKSIRIVRLGGPGRKKGFDVADFIQEMRDELLADSDGRADADSAIRSILEQRATAATPFVKGVELNILTMSDMKTMSRNSHSQRSGKTISLAKFLPSLDGVVRDLRTGDCVVLKGPTGSAKTMFAQAVAKFASNMKVLVFEIELAAPDLFDRWAAMENDCEINDVNKLYHGGGDVLTTGLEHIYVCPCSKPTPQYIEETIMNAELIIGERPGLVIIDYIQLVAWPERSSRYERFSNIAEYFRVLPNTTRTIFVVISQVARPDTTTKGERVPSRYDGKESGSIENSATLMLDIAPCKSPNLKKITVLKDTHSSLEGRNAEVGFIGEKAQFGDPVHSCGDVF